MARLALLLLWSLASISQVAADTPLQYMSNHVVKLTDKTFEDETQASTGQTTGSWLVWFYRTGDRTVIDGDMPEKEWFEDRNIILAVVHAEIAKETAQRFSITTIPSIVYLTNRKMYRYDGELTWEALQHFVTEGYAEIEGETVPQPRSAFMKHLIEIEQSVAFRLLLAGLAVVGMAIYSYLRAVREEAEKKRLLMSKKNE